MAEKKKAEQKILRVGIIQNDTVLEERLIRRRETVTVGATPKSTFIVPIPAMSKPVSLLQVHKGSYWLVVRPGMRGRVSLGGRIVNLADAAKLPNVEKRGDVVLVKMEEDSRGKLRMQDITVLFQFVSPPPTLPKPQLPASARGSVWSNFDYLLLSLLLLSFLCQGGAIAGVQFWWTNFGQYEAEVFKQSRTKRGFEALVEEMKDREQQKKEEEEKKEEEKEEEEVAEEAAPEPEPKPKKKRKRKEKPKKVVKKQAKPLDKAALKARRKKTVAKLRKNTLLKFVGGGAGGPGGMAANTLAGGVKSGKLASAWDATGGVAVAAAGEHGGYMGGPKAATAGTSYAKMSGKDLGVGKGLKTKKVKSKKKTKERKLKMRMGGKLGSSVGGKIDAGSVAATFKKRMSAIKVCYQKSLQKNPNSEGKVAIQFTIGSSGRISKIKVMQNTTGDKGLGKCISGKVKKWKFPRPDRGTPTFVYPFILKKG